MSEKYLTDQLFKTLNLAEPLMQGLTEAGFEHCTPIQAAALPALLDGRDVAGQAQTGTGKTATFLLAAMHRLLTRPGAASRKANQPRAVIVAPTRELALQIHRDAEQLGKHTGLRLGLAYGGTGYQSQRETIEQGVDILVGTPGRLIDYYKQHVYDLKAVEIAVIDEADRMFDLGFIADIRYMLRRMPGPAERLSLLFSATLSHRVMELAYEHMNDPQLIKIDSERLLVENVTEQVFYPANEEKIPLLIGMLNQLQSERIMVFVNTKHGGETVQNWLRANNVEAGLLTGDVPQPKRERLLREFTGDRLEVLVATDVAARGLHIPNVSHVINFDLPFDAEDYVHRIGRTARAGASGDAISFACERYAYSQIDIEDYIGHPLPRSEITPALLASNLTAPRRSASRNRRETRPARRDAAPRPQASRSRPARSKPAAKRDAPRDQAPPAADPTPATRPAVAARVDPAPRRPRRRQPEIPAIG